MVRFPWGLPFKVGNVRCGCLLAPQRKWAANPLTAPLCLPKIATPPVARGGICYLHRIDSQCRPSLPLRSDVLLAIRNLITNLPVQTSIHCESCEGVPLLLNQ